MQTLWLAIVVYSIGLGLVIHFKPAIMFNANGSWKEFGYQRSPRHTIFPFWLFAVVWAFVSYIVVLAMTTTVTTSTTMAIAGASASVAASFEPDTEDDEETENEYEEDEDENETETEETETETETEPSQIQQTQQTPKTQTPVIPIVPSLSYSAERRPRGRPRKDHPIRPGYYVVAPESEKSGLHKYIYYGPTPPPQQQTQSQQTPYEQTPVVSVV